MENKTVLVASMGISILVNLAKALNIPLEDLLRESNNLKEKIFNHFRQKIENGSFEDLSTEIKTISKVLEKRGEKLTSLSSESKNRYLLYFLYTDTESRRQTYKKKRRQRNSAVLSRKIQRRSLLTSPRRRHRNRKDAPQYPKRTA